MVQTDLTEYNLGSTDWPALSWSARRDACEWLELYHEVRVEATLLSPEHRKRSDAKLADLERPEPGDYPWCYLDWMYETADAGWSPQFAALGVRF